MKQILLILFLIFSGIQVNAQFAEKHALYFTGELNLGNYIGIDLNANYILEEKYSFKIGYSGFIRKAKGIPKDLIL